MSRFLDRRDAGQRLASRLKEEVGPDVLVIGLARGGVPVAYEVARRLRGPLDVLVVRKLGVPSQPELAMGAVGPGGMRVLSEEVLRPLRIPADVVERVAARERLEVERRERLYRKGRPREEVRGRHVVVVDDGLATGASMRVALAWLRAAGARKITVAVPAGSPETCEELGGEADELLCLTASEWLFAIGQFYDDFSPTSDDEVCHLLARAARQRREAHAGASR
ncbi:MAG TPA: phosphoribosyltransferase family protein [Polyangiaceae bacterium]|nr:phosphoribosyltransferase family protein [Polyangiaceae bacterium]